MRTIWLVIQGIFMGITNIIPGVSSGTMAVSFGIYDHLIYSISNLLRDIKRSMSFLFPLGIGIVSGVIFFAFMIEFLLAEYALITALAFVGLILGGLPILFKEFQLSLRRKNEQVSAKHGIAFLLLFIMVISLSLMQEPAASTGAIEMTFSNIIILFIIGVIAAATIVIPGISGSLVLMILGYYYQLIQLLNNFISSLLSLDWEGLSNTLILLVPFGLGMILGVILVSKAIEYLFLHYPALTYSGILGLVIASPFAVLYNTNAFADLLQSDALLSVVIGGILLGISAYITYKLGQISGKEKGLTKK